MKKFSAIHSTLRSRTVKISPERKEEVSREMILKNTENKIKDALYEAQETDLADDHALFDSI